LILILAADGVIVNLAGIDLLALNYYGVDRILMSLTIYKIVTQTFSHICQLITNIITN
jgi:hypothetical protein